MFVYFKYLYQISSPLVFKIAQHVVVLKVVLMFQKEFAQRPVAKPGDELLSAICKRECNSRGRSYGGYGQNNFRPPPKWNLLSLELNQDIHQFHRFFNEWDVITRSYLFEKTRDIMKITNFTMTSNLR
jgi:16S rRNA A1518/A1519 N6-dimethyltransferase RsmA/KsgA/DIM1 with predicted DNA glycosylase/AP lyase activity